MMNQRQLLYLICLFIGGTSCQGPKNKSDISHVTIYSFDEALPLDTKDFVEKQRYVLLSMEEEALFKRVDKLLAMNDQFYLFDHINNSGVLVFDEQGQFIRKIGDFGQGPNQINGIEDFQVRKNGEVLVLDALENRIIVYSPEGNWVENISIPVNAGGFIETETGWLFAINNDNQNDAIANYPKVGSFDTSFKLDSLYFGYTAIGGNTNVYYHAGLLSQTSGIVYNRPPDDTVRLFSSAGNLEKQILIDFGDSKLPEHVVNDITLADELKEKGLNHQYLQLPVKITNNLILGVIVSTKNDFWTFAINLKTDKLHVNKIDFSDVHFPSLMLPTAITPTGEVVTLIEPISFVSDAQPENYPEEVINHFENDGSVLLLHKLKPN
ncbi:6-bladed beta-propeller [Cyclobacterium plantarum]|uniref:6-bladed beta-propeller n=1 Tax=Cyclobacterium plantarum TaxID=2716263 RepID=A0ABX0HEL6_9BACT|nr:6-bladed beta-propeller [Cyclobacterium plantarum]NHE58789.1 6-bladed beta-propeller [Cyclobacterium plantarum]